MCSLVFRLGIRYIVYIGVLSIVEYRSSVSILVKDIGCRAIVVEACVVKLKKGMILKTTGKHPFTQASQRG